MLKKYVNKNKKNMWPKLEEVIFLQLKYANMLVLKNLERIQNLDIIQNK